MKTLTIDGKSMKSGIKLDSGIATEYSNSNCLYKNTKKNTLKTTAKTGWKVYSIRAIVEDMDSNNEKEVKLTNGKSFSKKYDHICVKYQNKKTGVIKPVDLYFYNSL